MIPARMIERNRVLAVELAAHPANYRPSLVALAERFLAQWGWTAGAKKNPAFRPR